LPTPRKRDHPRAPIKRIDIYVTPYYEAAKGGAAPKVAVGKTYDTLLASNSREDIVRARDDINRNNSLVTPMTMMVLAIRLYDVGLARRRGVLVLRRQGPLHDARRRVRRQVARAGAGRGRGEELRLPRGAGINGYAFCDVAKQQEIRAKAMKWVVDNPYKAMFLPQVPALPGDREQNLKKAIAEHHDSAAEGARSTSRTPANVAELKAKRKQNDADAMFCWK
jgi:hypothetical protein